MNIVQEKSPKSAEMKSVATGAAASDEKNKHLSELVGEDLKKALIGTWQLVSYQVELQETGEFIDAMGETPRGRVIFTPDNWWLSIWKAATARLRKPWTIIWRC